MQNLNPFIALFLSFSSRKLAERVHKGKKVRLFKDRHTQLTMEASIARKWTRLGRRVLRHQLAQVFAFSCIMTCFFMCRDGLSVLKACSYIFYLKWAFGRHVTWNSAVPDPNVWCCILLFLCTLGVSYKLKRVACLSHGGCHGIWFPSSLTALANTVTSAL